MTEQIRAIVVEEFGNSDVLKLREISRPAVGAGQIRLRTSLTSVNFADTQARRGGYAQGAPVPYIPGLDAVGIVEEIGPGVEGVEIGQRMTVFADGGSYAEEIVAKSILSYPAPEGVSDEDVSGIGVLITAYKVIFDAARVASGETVLIHAAAGSVGGTAVQLARHAGAGTIIGTVSRASKIEAARRNGADEVIDLGKDDLVERVRELTDGRGVDAILDSVAGKLLEEGATLLAPWGRLVVYGHASGDAALVPTPPLHRNNISIIGYSTGGHRSQRPAVLQSAASAVLDLVAKGTVKLDIGTRLPLAEAAAAHDLIESRESVGKILLDPRLAR